MLYTITTMRKLLCSILIIVLLLTAVCSFVACAEEKAQGAAAETIARWQTKYTAGEFGIRSKKNPFVEFVFSTGEIIRLELYPSVAPITVNNFITYVKEGFYEGIAFHRIISSAIQWGGYEVVDDLYTEKAATHPAIKGEFRSNGVNNTLSHVRGVISMARLGDENSASMARLDDMNSATSQVFICPVDALGYDGIYAAFGRVIDEESMSVVSRIASLETHGEILYPGTTVSSDVPVTRITILKATLVWNK